MESNEEEEEFQEDDEEDDQSTNNRSLKNAINQEFKVAATDKTITMTTKTKTIMTSNILN